VAKETLERLKAEKRVKEAEEFQAEFDEAMVRDCVVAVHWTGDAEVDLMVEEPSGTVCSLRNPRTTAGGVMVGDILSQTSSDNSGGHSEVYVCPKGFDGAYRLLIQRIWGKVTSGKVTVEVTTHYCGKNSITVSRKISFEKDQAKVVFDLKDGHRKESLREQQIANAAGGQLAINQQILAQQITAAIDPSALGSLAADRSGGTSGGSIDGAAGGVGGRFLPFAARGAVGYQPIIITLPAGAQLSATAVVSADRRYVRVSATPFFSGIGSVTTFNTSTGATSTSGGGNTSSSSGGGGNSSSGMGGGSSGSSGSGVF
jgi:ASC-1-like (ASCH) protein